MTVACRLKVYSKLLVCTVTSVMFFPTVNIFATENVTAETPD